MISTNDFKNGQTIVYEGQIYQVIDFLHVKPGKGGAFVRTTLRNLRSGAVTDVTFNAGIKVERADIAKTPMQYSYQNGDRYVFMNMETYEQIEIPAFQIKDEMNYIYEGLEVNVNVFNGDEIIGISLPDKVTLNVTETVEGVKGDNTKTNSLKDAMTNTGLLVRVPMFIKIGDNIVVSTADGSYFSRDNK
jgi:elongation factor P